jgi:hypothetical protein
MKKKKF